MQRGRAVDPWSTTLQMGLIWVLASARRANEAIEAARKLTRFRRYLVSGERSKALAVVREMETAYPERYSAYSLARLYAQSGHKHQALRWLEQAVEAREGWVNTMKVLPAFDGLRAEPRFQALLKTVGLDQ